MMITQKVRGVRCDKCKKEVSHVLRGDMPHSMAMFADQETQLAVDHRKECDGIVSVFFADVEA